MRVVIAGSRGITDYSVVCDAVRESGFEITEEVSGGAYGVDSLGERWAREHRIPCKVFPADWKTYGRSAGYRRNEQMADYADAVIAVWDGSSRGTKHMIDIANRLNLKVFLHRIAPNLPAQTAVST